MSTEISLELNGMEIDWGGWRSFKNHGPLFGERFHRPMVQSDLADDESVLDTEARIYEAPVVELKDRLQLLGLGVMSAERLYYEAQEEYEQWGYGDEIKLPPFEKITEFLTQNNIPNLFQATRVKFDNVFNLPALLAVEFTPDETLHESIFRFVDPYVYLHLLIQSKFASMYTLKWEYWPLVAYAGVDESEFLPEIDNDSKYLIVTEGSSDTFIIRKTLQFLAPHLADFFDFIDMHENYPFTGSGNLLNFVKGIAKLNVSNYVLVVFDNDAEGNDKYRQAQSLSLPENIKVITLPDTPFFSSILTIGPDGEHNHDINGKAVSIECFLDFGEVSPPKVRWSNFVKSMDRWQGALESKDSYLNRFKQLRARSEPYNFEKLEKLVSHLITECTNISDRC